ncbi:cell division protein FtsQ [Thermaurantimonas aggregans]|uniref:Cell division protein FtsQ n=1 Tax=Thermaurantimonas aggregans TaxID=2173829 RepID=A0A401XLM0_9FLAO|nr:hypothetical protein [Thermaurantimonas aggregans]MCX8147825.1 hypothetical protein [Thermaurantimonas aggregans]GCD77925.1 cell division protein FtsQ [Thermaurantimonas aggregans]
MKRKNNLFRLLILISLTIGYLVISGFAKHKLESSTIDRISIDIERYHDKYLISKDEILKLSSLEEQKSRALGRKSINIKLLEELLDNQKTIEKSEIFFTLSGELHIQVKPRYPLLRVLSSSKNYYIDNHCIAFPLSPYFSAHVPVIDGAINDEILEKIVSVLQKSEGDDFFNHFFSGFFVSERHEITAFSSRYDEVIFIGKSEQLEEKLLRLKAFYRYIYPTLENKKIKTINLTFGKQVICEYEQ